MTIKFIERVAGKKPKKKSSQTAYSNDVNGRLTKLEEEVSNLKAVVDSMMLSNANKRKDK